MARTKATAGFVVFPSPRDRSKDKPRTRSQRAKEEKRNQKTEWTQAVNPQESSPLFARLSAEIRWMIYHYVYMAEMESCLVSLRPFSASTAAFAASDSNMREENDGLPEEYGPVRPLLRGQPQTIAAVLGQSEYQIYRPPSLYIPLISGRPWDKPWPEQTDRPYGTLDRPKIYTALLQTCQLIHRESHHLPVTINTHGLSYPSSGALIFSVPTVATSYLSRFPPQSIPHVKLLHLFVSTHRLNTYHDPDEPHGGYTSRSVWAELAVLKTGDYRRTRIENLEKEDLPLYPREIRVTIRHKWAGPGLARMSGDQDALGRMLSNQRWGNLFGGSKRARTDGTGNSNTRNRHVDEIEDEDTHEEEREGPVKRLVIELETPADLRDVMLRGAVQDLRTFEFDVGDGWALVSDGVVREGLWTESFWQHRNPVCVSDLVVFIMEWTLQKKTKQQDE